MWRSDDEEQADGWWTTGRSGTEGWWSKSRRRGWTDSVKFGERFFTKEVKCLEKQRRQVEQKTKDHARGPVRSKERKKKGHEAEVDQDE